MKRILLTVLAGLAVQVGASAQQTLSLEQCRQMAIDANTGLEQARVKTQMAEYDRNAAIANYFPNITANGAWVHNGNDISLISSDASTALTNMGTTTQAQISSQMQSLMQAVMSNPSAVQEYATSPMWQTVLGALSQTDVSAALNQIGTQIDDAMHMDVTNVYAGTISLQQPVFMGGKIIASNRMADLALELSRSQYDSKYQETLIAVDQAYWQVVSIANKKKLAESYADLLEQMQRDVDIAVKEGASTQSDALQIRVKANEAQMLKTKSTNGLVLAKMLLCKQVGLPLDSDIMLEDESLDAIPTPEEMQRRSLDEILADRPETRSLELASEIYNQKVAIARADMMPKVMLTANYIVSNPYLGSNGFTNDWGTTWNVGVMVSMPIFHGTEALQKTRKAKAEAKLYSLQYDDACKMIDIQVEQLFRQHNEVLERLSLAESNLENAEENLRTATVGFEEGVVASDIALQAQTAWLQAHSEYIDAGIELQMNSVELRKAQGGYASIENETK